MAENGKRYGLLAHFPDAQSIYHAAEDVRDAGFKRWDVFTPFPIHGMDAAMGLGRSKVPMCTFVGGLTGFLTGMVIVWFMNYYDYPFIIGGRPYWSMVFPFPVYYELTILFGAFGTFFGMWMMNRLPQHHHPVFNSQKFSEKASDDQFFLVVEASDQKFDEVQVRALLENAGAESIELIVEEEEDA